MGTSRSIRKVLRKEKSCLDIISGVYKIENKNNHKVYIGSAKDIYKRWKEHLYGLKRNKHHSCKLQASYNRLKDKESLDFSIVEVVENLDELRIREQHYIDLYDAYHSGYNCSAKVDNPQYALKNMKKAEKNKKAKLLYSEFEELYNDNVFRFPRKILMRIEERQYSYDGIRRIILLMKMFNKFYRNLNDNYVCKILYSGKTCYMNIKINISRRFYVEYKFESNDTAVGVFPTSKSDVGINIPYWESHSEISELDMELFKTFENLKTLSLEYK